MEKVNYLPLGSVVIVKGGIKKMVVIARAVATKINGMVQYFDYGACLYPEGLMGDQILYFNHEQITKVAHEGFNDDDNKLMVENIQEWLESSNMTKGNPYDINKNKTQIK